MEYGKPTKEGTVRQLIGTVTTEQTGRLDALIVKCLREAGYDLEVQKMQTSNYTGKAIVKVYELI